VGARISTPVQTGPGAYPASCTMGTGPFPGIKSGRGVMLTPHSLLVPWSRKGRAIPLLPLWAVRPVEPQCLYKCALFLYTLVRMQVCRQECINPLNPELNPICYLLVLLGAHHFFHVSRIRVKSLTLRRLMSYIYMKHPFLMFLDHTQRRSTVGRTPLDE